MNEVQTIEREPTAAQSLPAAFTGAAATPLALLQTAVSRGAGIDEIERLIALSERMQAEHARNLFNEAFAAFKAEAVRIIKNRTVTDGPLKNKKYAELFAVVNAATPALSKHGLSAAWKITKDERDWIEVTCSLKHVAGHAESVSMGGPPDAGGAKNAMQARASTVSYLERYTLKAITGLSEQEDDDDGRGAGDAVAAVAEKILDKYLADLEKTTTDEAAAALWATGSKALAEASPAAYAEFKAMVVAHRNMLKAKGGAK